MILPVLEGNVARTRQKTATNASFLASMMSCRGKQIRVRSKSQWLLTTTTTCNNKCMHIGNISKGITNYCLISVFIQHLIIMPIS